MTWTKIDDQLHAHPKIKRAWHQSHAALGLHLLALSHAAAYLTDGHVSGEFVTEKLPRASERKSVLAALIGSELWDDDPTGDGYWIHDYLEFNESREKVMARRRADSDRKRPGIRVEA